VKSPASKAAAANPSSPDGAFCASAETLRLEAITAQTASAARPAARTARTPEAAFAALHQAADALLENVAIEDPQ
jgi:hypothetical protein